MESSKVGLLPASVVSLAFVAAICVVGQPEDYPIQLQNSGHDLVERFSAAIRIFLDLVNEGNGTHHVRVSPSRCCLNIAPNDTDCEIMTLSPPRELTLGSDNDSYHGNSSGRVVFMFRNLYARFRKGNCSFVISSDGELSMEWAHIVTINTYPDGDISSFNCTGIDQDPDRGCSPVDCAIKYKGRRNYYRNSTGRCEPVAECNTRGKDGISTVAYYDWEENRCHRYDWLEEGENAYAHVESDTEIPADVDPSRSKYFPDFEPDLLEQMAEPLTELNCNHGYRDGIYCVCEEGWISSGIHHDNPLEFHWCDVLKADATTYRYGPRKLSALQEVSAVVALFLGNGVMFIAWLYMVYRLCCRKGIAKACARLRSCCQGRRHNKRSPSTEELLQKTD